MTEPLRTSDLPGLSWLEIDLQLQAHAAPRRAHPMVVLEALLKGVFEAAGLDARHTKQLWYRPGHSVHDLGWQAGSTLPLTVQLFGMQASAIARWQDELTRRFEPPVQQNFSLLNTSAWRIAHPPPPPASMGLGVAHLDFLTPVPLPHQLGQAHETLEPAGLIRLCQTRLRKLFGREGQLPSPPTLDTSGWRYWRFEHRSRSQNGHPMFINGCVGPLHLGGEHLDAWLPWLALFSAVGMGERLSFGQGRFQWITAPDAPETHVEEEDDEPAPLMLRRPFVLDSDKPGAHLELAHGNLVVTQENRSALKLPLMRISHIELHSPCQISTPLIEACVKEGIELLLGTPGQPPLVISGGGAQARRHRRLAAHHVAWAGLSDAQRARVAARFVHAKLDGYEWLVRQRYQPGDHLLLASFERARAALDRTERVNVVRGWEGWSARKYQRWLERHTHGLGSFERRQLHGQSQDLVNSLLNYGYGLLRHHLARTVRLVGLDPWLGVLHEANHRHEALVSDFMEPWRPHIDRMVLRVIGLRIVQPQSFSAADGLLRLQPQAKARVVQEFTRMLQGGARQGGPRLATRIQRVLDSYVQASEFGDLAQWDLPKAPDSESTEEENSQESPAGTT